MILACLLMLFQGNNGCIFSDTEMDNPFTLWQKVSMLQQAEHILNIGL